MTLAVAFIESWPTNLRTAGERVLAAAQDQLSEILPEGTINLKLVNDAEIIELNTKYNGNAFATDVLTFNYSETGSEDGELADVVISTETAQRQAEAAGTDLVDEVGLLIAHALLHVAGHDHGDSAERELMERSQKKIVELAGLAYRDFAWK